MSTNYYVDDVHVGKISGAGSYCFSCQQTLCSGGMKGLHTGEWGWHKECPQCGRSRNVSPDLDQDNFNIFIPTTDVVTGVKYSISFTWAVEPNWLEILSTGTNVLDEYGRQYTKKWLWERIDIESITNHCILWKTEFIGRTFS